MGQTDKTVIPETIAARVAREKAAHEDSHIDDNLRKAWAVFPHVFSNPSVAQLQALWSEELGPIQNIKVLDYGCGTGGIATWLLDQGASVFGIDISEFNIERSDKIAQARGFDASRYKFLVMDAHATTLPDAFFDRIVGYGILHHLDLRAAMLEVNRLLKAEGKALFWEPLGDNPLLRLYRLAMGVHTLDERPLTREDLVYLREKWGIRAKYSGLVTLPVALLTSIILRAYPANWLLRAATWIEDLLNDHHVLDNWNRMAMLVYEPNRGSMADGPLHNDEPDWPL
jgi:SAM-dependent methyltransferase